MDKKGNFEGLLLIFVLIMLLLAFAIGIAIFTSIANNTIDIVNPTITGLGQVDNTNFTEIGPKTTGHIDTLLKSMNWFLGVIYAMALVMIFILAVSFRFTGSRWAIALFLLLTIVAIGVSMLMANTYSDLHDGTDSFAEGLQDQSILSFLILYSPIITTIISFIAGAIMFTGQEEFI